MAADLPERTPLDPDAVAGQSFTTVRKGFEPDEVRAFLLSVASSMRDAKLRYDDMERRLAEVERRAADPKDLDEHAVTQLLGEETARVLETARQAANDIRSRAESAAAEREAEIAERDRATREAADEYAAGVRSAADEADRRIRADADRYAEEVRSAADAETTAQRAAADEYDERIRSAADTEIAELRASASADAERLRAEASTILAERTAEAETAASAILGEADGYSTRVRGDADRYAEATRGAADSYRTESHASADAYKADAVVEGDRVREEALAEAARIRQDAEDAAAARAADADAEAQAALDAAREQGRQMVEEARSYRERVIADLADRRRSVRAQIDNLAATRDALAVALSDVTANLTASHRMLTDLDIDPTSLGDVAGDRSVLEASDAARPPMASPEPVDADALVAEVDAPVEDVAGDTDVPEGARHEADEPVEAAIDDAVPERDELDAGSQGGTRPSAGADAGGTDGSVIDLTAAGAGQEVGGDEPTVVVDLSDAATTDDATADTATTDDDATADDGAAAPEAEPVDDDTVPRSGGPSDAPTDVAEEDTANDDATAVNGRAPEGETSDQAETDPVDEGGPTDPREGRIDQIFARIRADRHDDPEPGADAAAASASGTGAGTATATVAADLAVAEEPAAGDGAADRDPDTDLLDRRDAALEEIEKQLARRLKRVLADEQNETLDLLRRTKGIPSLDAVLPEEAEHRERYRSATLEDLSTAERTGASFFGEAPQRQADVFDVAGDFATEIMRQIRAQLVRAFEDGGDEYELGDRIRSCYREWKTQRIADTASHFVIVAFSRGVAEAGADGDSFRWLLDDGDAPCPDCDDNQLGGAVPKGEPFPTGDLCPPAHPGCRCLAVPA